MTAKAQVHTESLAQAKVRAESLVVAKAQPNTEIYNRNRNLITPSFNSPSRVVYPVQEEHEGGEIPRSST